MKKIISFVLLLGVFASAVHSEEVNSDRAARQAEARAKRMVAQALSTLQEGGEERAIGLLEAVPKMFPEAQQRFVAYLELGRAHSSKGRRDEALVQLRKAAEAASPAQYCQIF